MVDSGVGGEVAKLENSVVAIQYRFFFFYLLPNITVLGVCNLLRVCPLCRGIMPRAVDTAQRNKKTKSSISVGSTKQSKAYPKANGSATSILGQFYVLDTPHDLILYPLAM